VRDRTRIHPASAADHGGHTPFVFVRLAFAFTFVAIALAAALTCGASPALAMTGADDCTACHNTGYTYFGNDDYHLSPGHRAIACYSLCHWGGVPAPIVNAHEADEILGNDYTSSDHWGEACDYCHQPGHPLIPQHTDAGTLAAHQSTTTGCEDCHSVDLIETHDAYPTCGVCHESGSTRVRSAIANNDTSCFACHDIPAEGHEALHGGGLAGTPVECAACHTDNISTEHDDDCGACHRSTSDRVLQAIADDELSCFACHPGYHTKTWSHDDYYAWTASSEDSVAGLGDNPLYPGVHGNYTATTAKCGVCHSVHRASASGVKLLKTAVASCAGCHQAGVSTVTSVLVSWESGGPHSAGDPSGCLTRSCHLPNPHGAGGSQYAIVAQKLLTPATDAALAAAVSAEASSGISAAQLNGELAPAEGGWSESTRSAVRTGYTCNQAGCHVQTTLAVISPGWAELRDATADVGTPVVAKTGHMTTGTPDGISSFVPVTSCVSCHDQTDSATAGPTGSTVAGYTFPHSQTAAGTSNAGTDRAWLWMTLAGNAGGDGFDIVRTPADKAKDGTCLKCHRDAGDRAGIGLPPVGTIVFSWTAVPDSWAYYYVHDSNGVLVASGYGEYGVDGWTGTFTVTVPVDDAPYQLSAYWLDPGYDEYEAYWTYDTALIDTDGAMHTFYY
jgi:predicted CXXCH cytochrome family protein